MSRERMLEHLREQGEQQIADLWEQARQKLRDEQNSLEQNFAQKTETARWESQRRAEQFAQISLLEARRKAGATRAKAWQIFADRLWRQALVSLPALKDLAGEQLMGQLLAELPRLEWTKIVVHPSDKQQAGALFPDVLLEEDNDIIGGFILEADEGRIRFVNTLNKRLEMAWQEMVSEMVAEIKVLKNGRTTTD